MKSKKWGQTPLETSFLTGQALILCLGLIILLGGFLYAQTAEEKDTILNALQDELARTMARLKLEKFDPPYYVAYRVNDSAGYSVSASFGAITGEGESRYRSISPDIRVGSYTLDSSSGYGGRGYGGFGGVLALDDDYDAFRQTLWLTTDILYKFALNSLARKKADLERKKMEDRPDDFSQEDPVVLIQPLRNISIDKEKWKAITKKVSAVFKEYPQIDNSNVSFSANIYSNIYFVNSEGFRERITGDVIAFTLAVSASTQCDDGMPVSDSIDFVAYKEKQMPKEEEIMSAAATLAEYIIANRNAPKADDYRGPVIFEGESAAEFFAEKLAHNLSAERPEERGYGLDMNAKLGKLILPKFLTCYDDPSQFEFNGKPLIGAYTVDTDGVKAQRITLIDKGRLATLYSSRVPTREIKKSNGHSKGGRGGAANFFVESTNKVSLEELKKRLLEEVEANDLEYGILVRKQGIYRLYLKDGKEELIRGGSFGESDPLRTLRDIMVTGDDTIVYNLSGGGGVSVICPSILVKELELKKPPEKFEKPPLTKNPYFEDKEKK